MPILSILLFPKGFGPALTSDRSDHKSKNRHKMSISGKGDQLLERKSCVKISKKQSATMSEMNTRVAVLLRDSCLTRSIYRSIVVYIRLHHRVVADGFQRDVMTLSRAEVIQRPIFVSEYLLNHRFMIF